MRVSKLKSVDHLSFAKNGSLFRLQRISVESSAKKGYPTGLEEALSEEIAQRTVGLHAAIVIAPSINRSFCMRYFWPSTLKILKATKPLLHRSYLENDYTSCLYNHAF